MFFYQASLIVIQLLEKDNTKGVYYNLYLRFGIRR
jgi:hypothetical protein